VIVLRDEAAARLDEVDAALARLSAGTYGVCEACGGPIAAERLDALPVTRRCVACAG
jgi:DnaK suppressor protein